MPDHHHPPSVAHEFETLANRGRVSRRLDDQVGALLAGETEQPALSLFGIAHRVKTERFVHAARERRVDPIRGTTDHEYPRRPTQLREDRRALSHRTSALNQNRVAKDDTSALHRGEAGGQAAAATHEVVDRDPALVLDRADAGAELDVGGPATEQAVRGARGDSVDTAVRAPRLLFCDQAGIARLALAEDIVERDHVASMNFLAEGIPGRAFGFHHPTARDVAGNDRPGHGIEPALVEVDVGPADLARQGFKQDSSRRKVRKRALPHFKGSVGGGHPDGFGSSHNPLLITVRLRG